MDLRAVKRLIIKIIQTLWDNHIEEFKAKWFSNNISQIHKDNNNKIMMNGIIMIDYLTYDI